MSASNRSDGEALSPPGGRLAELAWRARRRTPSPTRARARVSLVSIDVDGVLTDGLKYYSAQGPTLLSFHTRDSLGIALLLSAGIEVALFTNSVSEILTARARDLGVRCLLQGVYDKGAALRELRQRLALDGESVLHIGDDLWDLGAFREAGISVAVPEAPLPVRRAAGWITHARGGRGMSSYPMPQEGPMPDGAPRRVGILLFEGAEELDFCGPLEALAVGRQVAAKVEPEAPPLEVFTLAEYVEQVACAGGLIVVPRFSLATAPPADAFVVPGGPGHKREMGKRVLIDWIRQQAMSGVLATSVCTGAFLLAEAGLLDGHRATTHWAHLEAFKTSFPAVEVVENERVVDAGDLVTSGGVSAGIDLGLYLLQRLYGDLVSQRTARYINYERRIDS